MPSCSNRRKTSDTPGTPFADRLTWQSLARREDFDPWRLSLKIVGVYVLFGCLWILLSDGMVAKLISDKDTITTISMLKGWIYVFITGLLCFQLIYTTLRRIQTEAVRGRCEMEQLAFHDPLTSLPNRMALYADCARLFGTGPERYALISMDADNFKYINDTLGHAAGDQLLVEIGNRLGNLTDEESWLYRLGGDEFILLAKTAAGIPEAEDRARAIIRQFKHGFNFEENHLHINLSMGITVFPDHGGSVEELLRCADIALYHAKEAGRNRYIVYSPSMEMAFSDRMILEKHLHSALENEEFTLHYQPQYDVVNSHIVGFEALLRWHNAELGTVPPDRFIRIAEDTQMILPIGNWVLEQACVFLARIHASGHPELTMSINISAIQLMEDSFVERVMGVLDAQGLKPEDIELEITETMLIEAFDLIRDKLERLHRLGVKIALDDFGRGYSSLHYLQNLPIATLKIDKSFIDRIGSTDESESLVGFIIMIGRKMNLCVVAEGVEHQSQHEYLIKHECSRLQGYLFSRPVSADQVHGMLAAI
ncbi:MAG: putative bifunctional diguanylate cyclase/phosphodiesterase [Solirubrobacterales bacterium]